jgi:hypothetical protein
MSASTLSLFDAWAKGCTIAAGQCLLGHEPAPTALAAKLCPQDRCTAWIVGCSDEQIAERTDDHRRRCHV